MAQRRPSASLMDLPPFGSRGSASVLPITAPSSPSRMALRGALRLGIVVLVVVLTIVLVQQLSLVQTAAASAGRAPPLPQSSGSSSGGSDELWECPPCALAAADGADADGMCPHACLLHVTRPRSLAPFSSHALLSIDADSAAAAAAAAAAGGVIRDTPALPEPPCTDSFTGRYLSFRPQPGLDSYMADLAEALVLARRLRRTLIVPRLRLAGAGLRFNDTAAAASSGAAAAAGALSAATLRELMDEPGSVELASAVSLSPLAKFTTVVSSDSFAARLVSKLTDADVLAYSDDAGAVNVLVGSHSPAALSNRTSHFPALAFTRHHHQHSSRPPAQEQNEQETAPLGESQPAAAAAAAAATADDTSSPQSPQSSSQSASHDVPMVRLISIDELDRTACKVSLLLFDALRGRLLDVGQGELAEAAAAVSALFARDQLASLGVRAKTRRYMEQQHLRGRYSYAAVLMRNVPLAADETDPRFAQVVAWADRLRAAVTASYVCLVQSFVGSGSGSDDKCLAGPVVPIYLAAAEGSPFLARLKARLTRMGFRPLTLADMDAQPQQSLLEVALLDLALAADSAVFLSLDSDEAAATATATAATGATSATATATATADDANTSSSSSSSPSSAQSRSLSSPSTRGIASYRRFLM